MYKSLIIGFCVIATTLAVPTSTNLVEDVQNLDCWESQDTELFSCMAVKAVTALDRAARSNDIQILDGVTFVRTTPMERSGKVLKSELEVLNELPRDASDKTMKLVNIMYDSVVSFFKSHSLKFDIPEESRALIEGRAKGMKKMIFPLIAAVGVKLFALVPILLGGLGLLILKALFVSKIALLLAGVLAFQKLFGANGGAFFGKSPIASGGYYDAPASGGWSAAGSSYGAPQGYYKRSFDEKSNDPQSLVYSAHAPTESETQQ